MFSFGGSPAAAVTEAGAGAGAGAIAEEIASPIRAEIIHKLLISTQDSSAEHLHLCAYPNLGKEYVLWVREHEFDQHLVSADCTMNEAEEKEEQEDELREQKDEEPEKKEAKTQETETGEVVSDELLFESIERALSRTFAQRQHSSMRQKLLQQQVINFVFFIQLLHRLIC